MKGYAVIKDIANTLQHELIRCCNRHFTFAANLPMIKRAVIEHLPC